MDVCYHPRVPTLLSPVGTLLLISPVTLYLAYSPYSACPQPSPRAFVVLCLQVANRELFCTRLSPSTDLACPLALPSPSSLSTLTASMRTRVNLLPSLSVAPGAEAVAVVEVEGMCSLYCLLRRYVDSTYSRRGTPSTRTTVARGTKK